MTSKSGNYVQVEVRVLSIADDKLSGTFIVPGERKHFTIFAKDEVMGEWLVKGPGSTVDIRIASTLAERLGLYNQGFTIGGSKGGPAPQNG